MIFEVKKFKREENNLSGELYLKTRKIADISKENDEFRFVLAEKSPLSEDELLSITLLEKIEEVADYFLIIKDIQKLIKKETKNGWCNFYIGICQKDDKKFFFRYATRKGATDKSRVNFREAELKKRNAIFIGEALIENIEKLTEF